MAIHEEEHEKENSDRWLLTYADLITLLMAFFMVLYAMSRVDLKKFQKLGGSLSSAFNVTSSESGGVGSGTGKVYGTGSGRLTPHPPKIQPINTTKVEPEFREVATRLEEYRLAENIQARVRVTFDERGMIIQLDNNLLFPAGSAELTPGAQLLLDRVGEMLKTQPNHVRIEGHTDDTPIHTDRYPSNWQLSTDRATNVIMYWADRGVLPPDRLSAAGYGQYRPVVPNDSAEHRALNRRVEVVILRRSLTSLEPRDKSAEPAPGKGASGPR